VTDEHLVVFPKKKHLAVLVENYIVVLYTIMRYRWIEATNAALPTCNDESSNQFFHQIT